MSLNKEIIAALKPLNIPVWPDHYPGKQDTYITFFDYNESAALRSDDIKKRTGYYYQVDVWSKDGDTRDQLAIQVENLLTANGFTWRSGNSDYEPDTKVYHKVMRYYYAKNAQLLGGK